MKMDSHEIIAIFFVSIVLFLLLKNGSATVNVIQALGKQITNATSVLQGNSIPPGQ